jgi:F-type H+-transporting ATPase subunit b|tara:strand:+ start:467 stop:1045 length:579 start_codon:yes stop_codon:yes gene_type:complete
MKNFCFALCIASVAYINQAFGSEAGMPQLDTKFWTSQVFWLILIFSILYLLIWKIFLPKITYSIENRKSRIVSNLNEAQKLEENAEKQLEKYNKIIDDSKKEAKKIIEDSKKKLTKDIEHKKQKFDDEIEKELMAIEKEIQNLKKSSISNINKIAAETSVEVIKQIINTEVNKSSVSAIVSEIVKNKVEKHI